MKPLEEMNKDELADFAKLPPLNLILDKRNKLEDLARQVKQAQEKAEAKPKPAFGVERPETEYFKNPVSGMVLKVSEHPWLKDRKDMIPCLEDGTPK